MKRHLLGIVIGILAIIAGQAIYSMGAETWGGLKARLDLLRGKHFILAYCGLAEKRDEYNKVLKPYGIELVVVGGCHVSKEFSYEVRGYNFVSVNAINEKYGNDFLLRTLPQNEDKRDNRSDANGRVPTE